MASQSTLVENDAFSRLLEEHPDRRPYEMAGYLYLTVKERDGWVTYRTYGPKWARLYQARRVLTSPAGGGVLQVRISAAPGTVARFVTGLVLGPASNTTLLIRKFDEDAAAGTIFVTIAAGVSNYVSLPNDGSVGTASAHVASIKDTLIGPNEYIACTAAASLQNETLTVAVTLLLPFDATANSVVWDTTGSVAGATLAASTISAANTLQAVLLP